jgi:hypothetical protein
LDDVEDLDDVERDFEAEDSLYFFIKKIIFWSIKS